eukprot:1162146-Pelagomonas_calceolata.AAC.2
MTIKIRILLLRLLSCVFRVHDIDQVHVLLVCTKLLRLSIAKRVAVPLSELAVQSAQSACRGSDTRVPVVGFCFSFPMEQTSLTQGVLVDWTKGFTCTGTWSSEHAVCREPPAPYGSFTQNPSRLHQVYMRCDAFVYTYLLAYAPDGIKKCPRSSFHFCIWKPLACVLSERASQKQAQHTKKRRLSSEGSIHY